MKTKYLYPALFFSLITISTSSYAKTTYTELVKNVQLTEVAATITDQQIAQTFSLTTKQILGKEQVQAALLLTKLGCLDKTHISDIYADETLQQCAMLDDLTLNHHKVPNSLRSALNTMLMNGVFEGYNIKKHDDVTSSSTAPELILYGHDNLIHAKQLLSLLTLNNITYNWRLLPKTSAFKIRDGWGDAKSDEKKEKIRSSDEYDLQITFPNLQEKLKFMPLINQFAKRNSSEQKGLIFSAWWQPFYRTFKTEEHYQQVKRISFNSSQYVGSTLVLNENYSLVIENISSYLATQPTNLSLSTEDVWVNPSFYRYLNGNFK
jgi:hypothetical protein